MWTVSSSSLPTYMASIRLSGCSPCQHVPASRPACPRWRKRCAAALCPLCFHANLPTYLWSLAPGLQVHTELVVLNGRIETHMPKARQNLTGNEERRLSISLCWRWFHRMLCRVCPLMWCSIEHVACWCLIHFWMDSRSARACFHTNLGHLPRRMQGQRRWLCAELQSCHKELTGGWDSKRDLLL